MGVKLFSILASPFVAYFDATVAEPFRALFVNPRESYSPTLQDGDMPEDGPNHHVRGNQVRCPVPKNIKRERKPSFSFFRCLQQQRLMTSRETEFDPSFHIDSVRDHYLRESEQLQDGPTFIH